MSLRHLWTFGLVATIGLILLAVLLDADALWGINHFKYNAPYGWWLLGLLVLGSLHCAFGWLHCRWLERRIEGLGRIIWGRLFIVRFFIAAAGTGLFYLFQVQTAFIGDGYFLLNTFGRGEAYSSHLTKPVSIWIIDGVQWLLGGYTYWTALSAFQTISIVAGFFVVYNFITIAGLIAASARGRLLAFATMLFGGWILLFLGYIEFYPMLWLAATFFVRYAIAFARGDSPFWPIPLTFLIAAAVHLQTLIFLPGLLYLAAVRIIPGRTDQMTPRRVAWLAAIAAAMVLATVVVVGQLTTEISNLFLPLFKSDSGVQGYGMLSTLNLLEAANETLLCIPTLLILLTLALSSGRHAPDRTSHLLGWLSFGSLAFLLTINPELGMARDFDLMTLTLFAPTLWLLRRIDSARDLSIRPILAAAFVSVLATTSFLGANCVVASSVERAHDLLEYYGVRDKQGWLSFAKYLQADGQTVRYDQVNARISALFPEQGRYQTALSLIVRGKLAEAEQLILSLINAQPENGEYRAALGEIRVGQERYPEAAELYRQALRTHPNHRVYAGLGRACLMMNDFDSAIAALETADGLSPDNPPIQAELCRAYRLGGRDDRAAVTADRILRARSSDPEAHLTKMLLALKTERGDEAVLHYRRFVDIGAEYPGYDSLKTTYSWLLRER